MGPGNPRKDLQVSLVLEKSWNGPEFKKRIARISVAVTKHSLGLLRNMTRGVKGIVSIMSVFPFYTKQLMLC